jgi:HNH endonuclease
MEDETMSVIYKDIAGFPGYRIGDDGSVWSRRRIGCVAGLCTEWRRLKGIVHEKFYQKVTLCNGDSNQRQVLVHILVLEVFVGPCPEGMEACHNDGAQAGHHLKNLRWDTPLSNHADKRRHGTNPAGSKHGRSKLTESQVMEFRQQIAVIAGVHQKRAAVSMAVKTLGISYEMGMRIISRKNWTHI